MNISGLYSAIIRGQWFLSFQEAESPIVHSIISRLVLGDLSGWNDKLLSDTTPISMGVVASSESAKQTNSFSDASPGTCAIIPIHGTLLKYGTMCSYGTTKIAAVIKQAVSAPNISSIILDMDSGGGAVDAIAPLVDAIAEAKAAGKPVIAFCDCCASAMYYVACHCNEIIASNSISSAFGSIGVMMSFRDYEAYYAKEGLPSHTIYSSLSTQKNEPFELARKGEYDKIKEETLDPLALGFQNAVKSNRPKLNTDANGVLQGRMFWAKDALEIGLIDGIGSMEYAVTRSRELQASACIQNYINSKS